MMKKTEFFKEKKEDIDVLQAIPELEKFIGFEFTAEKILIEFIKHYGLKVSPMVTKLDDMITIYCVHTLTKEQHDFAYLCFIDLFFNIAKGNYDANIKHDSAIMMDLLTSHSEKFAKKKNKKEKTKTKDLLQKENQELKDEIDRFKLSEAIHDMIKDLPYDRMLEMHKFVVDFTLDQDEYPHIKDTNYLSAEDVMKDFSTKKEAEKEVGYESSSVTYDETTFKPDLDNLKLTLKGPGYMDTDSVLNMFKTKHKETDNESEKDDDTDDSEEMDLIREVIKKALLSRDVNLDRYESKFRDPSNFSNLCNRLYHAQGVPEYVKQGICMFCDRDEKGNTQYTHDSLYRERLRISIIPENKINTRIKRLTRKNDLELCNECVLGLQEFMKSIENHEYMILNEAFSDNCMLEIPVPSFYYKRGVVTNIPTGIIIENLTEFDKVIVNMNSTNEKSNYISCGVYFDTIGEMYLSIIASKDMNYLADASEAIEIEFRKDGE